MAAPSREAAAAQKAEREAQRVEREAQRVENELREKAVREGAVLEAVRRLRPAFAWLHEEVWKQSKDLLAEVREAAGLPPKDMLPEKTFRRVLHYAAESEPQAWQQAGWPTYPDPEWPRPAEWPWQAEKPKGPPKGWQKGPPKGKGKDKDPGYICPWGKGYMAAPPSWEQKACYTCGSLEHLRPNCPQRKPTPPEGPTDLHEQLATFGMRNTPQWMTAVEEEPGTFKGFWRCDLCEVRILTPAHFETSKHQKRLTKWSDENMSS